MKNILTIMILSAVALMGAGCKKPEPPSASQTSQTDSYSISNQEPAAPKPAPIANSMNEASKEGPVVVMKTSMGDITLQLFEAAAPKTVKNFVDLAKKDFYDGVQFHRVIRDFMIQGGDPLSKSQPENFRLHGTGGPGYTFEDEINAFKLVRGRLAMANAGPDTNGSQFFIVTTAETPWLDGRHTVFGEVISGMDVVDRIEGVKTAAQDHPAEPVTITDIIIQESAVK